VLPLIGEIKCISNI